MQSNEFIDKAKALLDGIGKTEMTRDRRREEAISLAGLLMNAALHLRTPDEKTQQDQIAAMMQSKVGMTFTTSVADQSFLSSNARRAADQINYLIGSFGVPPYFSFVKKMQLKAFKWFGKPLASIVMPLLKKTIRKETERVILPAELDKLHKHLEWRKKEGVRINLNHLGEAILGEKEALARYEMYLKDLADPAIEYVSIKITTLYSQINHLAEEASLDILSERLGNLYRLAKANLYTRRDGTTAPKFVNLDMEEYQDLHLTVKLFKHVLDMPEFQDYSAGIVLQAYLPDSHAIQKELTEWAKGRVKKGGAPIKIRIVKGANLAMERVQSALKGWPQAPFETKKESDANFKRMLEYGCKKENAAAVIIGIGSHNLMDVAYGMILRAENGTESRVCFEMLEGMADPVRRAVHELAGDMLLYCPVARDDEFRYALAYLIRRLDENTAPKNFLRYVLSMVPGDEEWQEQAQLFSIACEEMDQVSKEPRRTQNRFEEPPKPDLCSPFENESDTDWALSDNCAWAHRILEDWSRMHFDMIPLVVDGSEISSTKEQGVGRDPSAPGKELFKYAKADPEHVEKAIATAVEAGKRWAAMPTAERSAILAEAAHALRLRRADLIGCMVANGGKTIPEADGEVSEAIDFAEYYRRNMEEIVSLSDVEWHSKGAALVAPPWNFPCSIPAGGILAALAAGNSVIFKPAPEAVLAGWVLSQILWEAGISRELLQFLPCSDDPVGSSLIRDPRISVVLLTGATDTAKKFMKMRPGIDLVGETGGKNSIIITAMADRDLAIKSLIQSAFGHAGQKCSACSLAICEAEVYDDPLFRKALRDASESICVGSQWDPATKVNPLVIPPQGKLLQGLTQLEKGEEWLLEPKQDPSNPALWSPGIKMGVTAESFTYKNELFGPVLALMRADNLDHAIRLANGTPYGLTAGLQSLDPREQAYWTDRIEAGNLYINRGITGAIVQRQPFGGCKESNFGGGAKAGGPNFLMQLMNPSQKEMPREKAALPHNVASLYELYASGGSDAESALLWNASAGNYAFYWNHYFSKQHDPSNLLGQDNIFKYVPRKQLTLRLKKEDSRLDVFRVIAAAMICNAPLEISGDRDRLAQLPIDKIPSIKWSAESTAELARRIRNGEVKRVRYLSAPDREAVEAAAESACTLNAAPVLANGRLELLHYLREVAVSFDYHRYGYLGAREDERRRPLPQAAHTKASCEHCVHC